MILEQILANKRLETAALAQSATEESLRKAALAAPAPRDFAAALAGGRERGIRLIAEYKRGSPSKGTIRADLAPAPTARLYESAGAAAISVLTDKQFFSGTLDDLRAVRAAVNIPVLRKDFIIDPLQILEARAAGADAVLLIAAALDDRSLREFRALSLDLGMECLIEAHDEEEAARAAASGARIIGINNRDLRTFRVDIETTLRLRKKIPPDRIAVSESGIATRADALRLQEAGVDAMLVGETLMRRPVPAEAVRELLGMAKT